MSAQQPHFTSVPTAADSSAEHMAPPEPAHFDAIVMAGGHGSRLGGVDKAAILLQGVPLVDRCIDAVRSFGAERVIVAGPRNAGTRADACVRESPLFSGPLAALDVGIQEARAPWVMVLACDLVSPSQVADQLNDALSIAPPDVEGILLEDEAGYPQWLASAFRTKALLNAVEQYRIESGTLENASLRAVFQRLRLQRITARPGSTEDIDTPEQLADARTRETEAS